MVAIETAIKSNNKSVMLRAIAVSPVAADLRELTSATLPMAVAAYNPPNRGFSGGGQRFLPSWQRRTAYKGRHGTVVQATPEFDAARYELPAGSLTLTRVGPDEPGETEVVPRAFRRAVDAGARQAGPGRLRCRRVAGAPVLKLIRPMTRGPSRP